MIREAIRFFLMILVFILVTQLYALSPPAQAVQTNGNKQTYMRKIPSSGKISSRQKRCVERCKPALDRCLAQAGNSEKRKRSCAVRARNCARRCGVNV